MFNVQCFLYLCIGSEGLGFESQRDHTGIGEANPVFERRKKEN